ncbi:MAG: hypothetical protein IIZ63_13895 [Caulobacteraceae bacterium]|nr:hypothetical protein [Caulobacteraceae bacterium]
MTFQVPIMVSITLHPSARLDYEQLIDGLSHDFPSARVEASCCETWQSYRVDVTCDGPRGSALEAWLKTKYANCRRT